MWLNEVVLNAGQAQAVNDANERLPQVQMTFMRGDCALKVPSGHLVLVLPLTGSIRIQTGDGQFQLRARHWMLLEREAAPGLLGGRKDMAVAITLSAAAWKHLNRSATTEALPGRGRMNATMVHLLCAALRESAIATGDFWRREPMLRSLFAQIELLQSDLRSLLVNCPGKSRSRRLQVMSRLQRARLYVEGHSNRVVRIGELASLTNFSHWYFTKSFHRVYGMSPKDFGIQVRLTQARELLRDQARTVSEVAAACGFENNSAFARAFRNYFGCPASVLRLTESTMEHGSRSRRIATQDDRLTA